MRSGVSPSVIISTVPTVRTVFSKALFVFVLINLIEAVAHTYDPAIFAKWVNNSERVVRAVSLFVPAIDQIEPYMSKYGYGSRVELMQNVIALNFITYLGFLLFIVAIAIKDFDHLKIAIVKDIGEKLSKYQKTYEFCFFGHLLILLGAIVLALTSFGYCKPMALYYGDIEFIAIGILFYLLLLFSSSVTILSIAFFYRRSCEIKRHEQ